MNVYQAIVAILRADQREYTSRELLDQLVSRYQWKTKSKTPEKTLDARLAHVVESARYAVMKKKTDRGTVFFYDPEKRRALESRIQARSPLAAPPITVSIKSKTARSGRVDLDHLLRVLSACAKSIKALARSDRGPGGMQPSNYELEIIGPPREGSLAVQLAPVSEEGLDACRKWFTVSRTPRFLKERSAKALEPLEGLSDLVGLGHPLESIRVSWPLEREEPLDFALDQAWFDSVPDGAEEELREYPWTEKIREGCTITVGDIDEVDKGNRSFRLKTASDVLSLRYDSGLFDEVDRDRWKRVAVLHLPPDEVIDLARITHDSELSGTIGRVFEPDALAVSERLRVLERVTLEREVGRRLLIMQWAGVPFGKVLPAPFITAEDDGGLGLWWHDPLSKRELDLDFLSGSWNFLKTASLDALQGPISDGQLAAALTDGEIDDDAALVEASRWLLGIEGAE